MSLLDLVKTARKSVAVTGLTILVAGMVAGCQVRPLYGPTAGSAALGNSSVQAELAAIEVEPISDSVQGRELLNELIFKFERGTTSPEKRYSLKVLMDTNTTSVGVVQLSDVPSAYSLTMNATFVLTDLNTEKTVTTGRSFATASYNHSVQRFSNLRASREAGERVARAVAEDIHVRLAGFFASHN
ncbi:MAG: hypothetical protein HWE23_03740 [Rhodobacteraceae bacterium]|nr:hypothetical protein [Paracoccaceae bacterium]